MSEQLPTGLGAEIKPDDSAEVVDLKKAVNQSSFEIAEAQTAAATPKRGRGRPKKIKTEATGPSVGAADQMTGAAQSVETPSVDYSKITGAILKLPFDVAATRTRVEKIRATDEEIHEPALLASELVNIYMPALATQDPKSILVWSFAASMGMLVYSKFLIFKAEKPTSENPVSENSNPSPNSVSETGPTLRDDSISADAAFRSRSAFAN